MALAPNPSAGVYTAENDLSIRATALPTSIGAVVGRSKKGEIGVPVLTVDTEDFSLKFGKSDPTYGFLHLCAKPFLHHSNRLYVVRVANNALYGGFLVTKPGNFSVPGIINAEIEDPSTFSFLDTDLMLITGHNQGAWNNALSIIMYPDTNDPDEDRFVIQVLENNITVETFVATLFSKIDGYGRQLHVEEATRKSKYIKVRLNPINAELIANPVAKLVNAVLSGNMTGGDDGEEPTVGQYIQAWNLFEDAEEITVNILINAGLYDVSIQHRMLEIAAARDDAFAILDVPPMEQEAQDAVNYRRNTLAFSTSYGALYSPDVLVRDTDSGRTLYVPPSGHVGAVFAFTDVLNAPWFAPAGLNRGLLDVIGVRHVYKIGHRNMFADNQVNPIQFMSGQGIVVWGADTLQSFASSFSNINVRRLVSMLKTDLRLATLPGVFEPNDDLLRAELRRICNRRLDPVKRGRGVYDFEVVCDERNNTDDLIANGDIVIDIYIDPVIPAKRIHLNAIATRTGGIAFAIELLNAA